MSSGNQAANERNKAKQNSKFLNERSPANYDK